MGKETFRSWGRAISTEGTNELLHRLAQVHISRITDEGLRKSFTGALSANDYRGLCGIDVPYATCGLNNAIQARQVLAFFQKRADLDFGLDKRGLAIAKFVESERQCRLMNEQFRSWEQGILQFPPDVEAAFHTAQRKISQLLGAVPSFEALKFRFGPGSTTQVPKRTACTKVKLSQPLACSGDMSPIIAEILAEIPHVIGFAPDEELKTVPVEIHAGKVVTVPKTAEIDRTVIVEPWLNSFVQLGIGDYISSLLKTVGLDLKNQEKNKSLARIGSLTGELATLDLSSASDSISIGLVQHLLPPEWFDLLMVTRTSLVSLDGQTMRLEKISSMGNGWTFPLETLIFWALAKSVSNPSDVVSVYGDDIICSTRKAEQVVEILRFAGFKLNVSKSFIDGPFRESCGGDYFRGTDVRPCYIKDRMSGHDAFRLHNFYVGKLDEECANIILEYIEDNIRLFGPQGYGDGHLHETQFTGYRKKEEHIAWQWGGRLFDTFTYTKREFRLAVAGDRLLPTYSIYIEGDEPSEDEKVIWEETYFAYPSWLREYLGKFLGSLRFVLPKKSTKSGVRIQYVPGRKGYRRISIYTLS